MTDCTSIEALPWKRTSQREPLIFFVRVVGCSTKEAETYNSDLGLVDRAVEPDGVLTVDRHRREEEQPVFLPENDTHDPIPIAPGKELVVWGVVQHMIHGVG